VFDKCVLEEADFRDAKLNGASFCRSTLSRACFGDAKLFAADLRAADLRGAHELTPTQLGQARTSDETLLPNGFKGPYMKGSGAERPARRR
jgi:uncharacterized protein YjbI with pentapeptide repeats